MAENNVNETVQQPAEGVNESTYEILERQFTEKGAEYQQIIKNLSTKLKDITSLEALFNDIYVVRQDCVDYIQKLMFNASKYARIIKRESVERYKFYKMNSQIRYTSDNAINNQIEVDLEAMLMINDLLKTHIHIMEETLININNMMYGIKERVEIYKMLNGMKF